MYKNTIISDFHKSLINSLFKTGEMYVYSKEEIQKAYENVKGKIDNGMLFIDEACDEFAKSLVNSKNQVDIEKDIIPEGLALIFSGKLGSKLYLQTDSNKELVTNDESLLARDLNDLKKSFYSEDYLESDKFHKMILNSGLINIQTYLK